jgi:hypothetical protein
MQNGSIHDVSKPPHGNCLRTANCGNYESQNVRIAVTPGVKPAAATVRA